MNVTSNTLATSARPAWFPTATPTVAQRAPVETFSSTLTTWAPPTQQSMSQFLARPTGVPAQDYTSQFCRSKGWTGADGTYSVSLPDGRTVWLFSDTFVGDLTTEGARGPNTKFVNNTIAVQKGPGQIDFFHGGTNEQPKAVFTPPDGKGWFWLHDAVADSDGKLHVMLGQFDRAGDGGALGFEAIGGWLAEMEVTPEGPEVSGYQKLPHFQKAEAGKPAVFFGTSMMREEDNLYVYGVRDHGFTKEAVVARVPADQISKPEAWQFFDGKGWSAKMDEAQPIAENVSVEQSVHRAVTGDYVMVSMGGGISADVTVRTSPTPQGPWSKPKTVYTAPENSGQDVTYNAKAHPELSGKDGLLISYNVNTLDWNRNVADGGIYRPRFIRVPDPTLLPDKAPS